MTPKMIRKNNLLPLGGWQRLLGAVLAVTLLLNLLTPAGPSAAAAEKASGKPLAGRTISVLGDSISTYAGWSDADPITEPGCTNRYGEAYYGPAGGDYHNTELLVTDTWWHQAADELGADILRVNSGNSTGLLYASYPANADWQLYLTEMLAYKSRPDYLGKDGKSPDIIALYIGSNDVSKGRIDDYGSIDQVDFSTLITGARARYRYAAPTTVAEAYCILLHKVRTAYPDAEIYCFTVVPSAGGKLDTCNKRLAATVPFNAMIKGVADHYGAVVVDLLEAFELDPDGDGVATEADFARFRSGFNNDPHPNADGFDVISRAFVSAVRENSRYMAQVETRAGLVEEVPLEASESVSGGVTTLRTAASDHVTAAGMIVDYQGQWVTQANGDSKSESAYTSVSSAGDYKAEGGEEKEITHVAPLLTLDIPLTASEDGAEGDFSQVSGDGTPVTTVTGDPKSAPDDGVYDYTVTTSARGGSLRMRTRFTSFVDSAADTGEGMTHLYNPTMPTADNQLITNCDTFQRPQSAADVPAIAKGYDYVYIGSDQLSNFWSAHVHTDVMDSFPAEQPVLTDEVSGESYYVGDDHVKVFQRRKLMVPRYYFPGRVIEGNFPARYDSIQQFVLSNAQAQLATAYCAWQGVTAVEGYSYRMQNVQDVEHFGEEAAQMLRTVARNGYWGTAEGYGSLDAMREMMLASGKFTQAEADALTDGIAMTATQYAIWTFSNERDGIRYINAYYTNRCAAPNTPADKEDADLIFKLYHHLISLEPAVIEPEDMNTYNTIINEHHFLDAAAVTIKDKPADDPRNRDADPANDAYLVDLSFVLKVQPAEENDDHLVMTITDAEYGELCSACIAGEPEPGEIRLYPDGNDIYTFRNVLLEEGQMNITFSLTGRQNLGMDVYLYNSEIRDGEPSQTMVGVAAGARNVDVNMVMGLELEVGDDVHTRHRVWRTEEPTPPVDVPPTGDHSRMAWWLLMMTLSAAALVGIRRRMCA